MPEQSERAFTPEESAIISESVSRSEEIIGKKVGQLNWLMGAVVIVLFAGFAAMFVAVAALIIDSSRFNSTTCREYSAKIETNNALLEAVKQNQKAIQDLAKRFNDK